MALTRKENWATEALHNFFEDNKAKPFEWGSNDCALFAASAIEAVTGVDIASEFRGKYTDEASAFALIKTVTGGSTVADAAAHCAAQHNMPELTHPLMARRGDLVVVSNGDDQMIAGVVHLDGRYVASVNDSGIVYLPIRSVIRAWRVG